MEIAIIFAQTIACGLVTLWLTTGVLDNIRHPRVNETYTAEVMGMTRMAKEFPAAYAPLAHRAITDRRLQKAAFQIVVAAEVIATLVLWIGTISLAMAMIGISDLITARALAIFGTALFTGVWGIFLVVGNYFGYWMTHESVQQTHFQMTAWGLGTMILLGI